MYAAGHYEVIESLSTTVGTIDEELPTEEVIADRHPGMPCHDPPRLTYIKPLTSDLVQKRLMTFESNGDVAVRSKNHRTAITQYSTALSLNPSSRVSLLVKRSNTRAMLGMWEDALKDADELWLGPP